jgi:phosphoribosylformimino-5-aminoimidazole carboxamide ribotide isomerase
MIKIIPAIDIIDGKCVRLEKGNYEKQKTYSNDPLLVAKSFEDAGFIYLHLVDLDGAKAKHIVNWKILEKIAKETRLKLAFRCGACQVTAGSIAIECPETVEKWISSYGKDKIIIGADSLNNRIAIQGWQKITQITILDLIREYAKKGINHFTCTDIRKDGMLEGPNFGLYENIKLNIPNAKIIASGGISSANDIKKLNNSGIYGVIIGKALYEKRILFTELKKYL